jgi:hypothetical protein
MKRVLFFALLAASFAAAPARAADNDLIFEGADFTVRLLDRPCDSLAVVALLARITGVGELPRKAVLEHGRTVIASCWVPRSEQGQVLVAGEDGKGAVLPMDGFKRVPGV